jgi:O-antigen/teichoic acid export membrane protein
MEAHETRKRALTGSAWTLFGYGASQVIRLGSNLILAHLLFPEAFGIMALVNVFIQGLHMFSDIGIGPSIIQNRRGSDPDFLDTAWTIQVIRGLGLWIACCLIAWPVSQFFSDRNEHTAHLLFWIMPVIGFSSFISGFNATSVFTLNRTLHIGAVTLLEMVPQILSIFATVLWAWIQPGVWALVGGSILYSVIRLPMTHWMNRPLCNRLRWDREAVVEIRRFGTWIFLGTIVAFLASNLDRIILGKLLTLAELGVYSMALTFARVGTDISTRLSTTVLFPVLSRSQDDPVTLVGQCLKARSLILLAGGALACAFAIAAPLFFKFFYDARYAAAGSISQWLSIFVWFSIVLNSMERVPMALGHSRALFISGLLTTAGYAFAIPGYWYGHLPGFIMGLSLGVLISHIALLGWIPTRRNDMLLQTVMYTACFAIYGGAAVFGMKLLPGHVAPPWELATGLLLAVVPCAIAGILLFRKLRAITSG